MDKRMRIAVVSTSYPADEDDAAGHFVRAEVRLLERAGHVVTVITPRAANGEAAEGGAFGWPGVATRIREHPTRAIDALRWMWRAARELRVEAANGGVGFDRVIAHWALPCAWPIVFYGSRAPLEVVSHGGDVRALLALPPVLRGAIVRTIARRCVTWRFVSHALADDLLRALSPLDRARVDAVLRVAPSPIEIPAGTADAAALLRTDLAKARDAPTPGKLAVTVARLVPAKRIDRVIAHAAACGFVLVVVGDGPERARLEALAKRAHADVRFLGKLPRSEALAWIGAADVVLHASEAEGLSTVIREAEALRVRVERL